MLPPGAWTDSPNPAPPAWSHVDGHVCAIVHVNMCAGGGGRATEANKYWDSGDRLLGFRSGQHGNCRVLDKLLFVLQFCHP